MKMNEKDKIINEKDNIIKNNQIKVKEKDDEKII